MFAMQLNAEGIHKQFLLQISNGIVRKKVLIGTKTGKNIKTTAEEIGSARASVHRWLKEDNNFIAFLNQLKNENIESTLVQIQLASSIAVNTLVDVMQNSNNDIAKINAADKILSMSGMTINSMRLYGWGIGADTPEKVEAQKQSEKMTEALSNYVSGVY